MSLNAYQALIAELGQSLGAADMTAGEDGYIGLKIDGHEVHIQYEGDDDIVVLYARLQEVEPERRDAINAMLLAANVFWQGTRGATFSADFDTGRIFLADRRGRAALDLESLSTWIEGFSDIATYWRERIGSADDGGPLGTGGAGGTAPAAPSGGGFPGMPPGGMMV
jgi:hypothetical protein